MHEYWCVFIHIFKGEWSEEKRKNDGKNLWTNFYQASMEFTVHESQPQTHKNLLIEMKRAKKESSNDDNRLEEKQMVLASNLRCFFCVAMHFCSY